MFRTLYNRPQMLALSAVVLAVTAHTGWPAEANNLCAKRQALVDRLASTFGETRRAYGSQASDGLVEVFASESGSWTILVTSPDGHSCIA